MKTLTKYWESDLYAIPGKTKAIINEYLLTLKLMNYAETTVIKYRKILERFFAECTVPLEEMTSDDVREWLIAFASDKKPGTTRQVLTALTSFSQFCRDEGYINDMIVKKYWVPRLPEPIPNYLNVQEYARVKQTAEALPLPERSLIIFLLSSGCRGLEISNLNIGDVNFEQNIAELKGNRNRKRYVRFSEECASLLKEYLKTRSGDASEPLFINTLGKRIRPQGVYEMTKKLGYNAGLKGLTPRRCRNTTLRLRVEELLNLNGFKTSNQDGTLYVSKADLKRSGFELIT